MPALYGFTETAASHPAGLVRRTEIRRCRGNEGRGGRNRSKGRRRVRGLHHRGRKRGSGQRGERLDRATVTGRGNTRGRRRVANVVTARTASRHHNHTQCQRCSQERAHVIAFAMQRQSQPALKHILPHVITMEISTRSFADARNYLWIFTGT